MTHAINIVKAYAARFRKDLSGSLAVEFAMLLPIFIIMALAAIEFGVYFTKNEIANNAISTISQNLQRNTDYYTNLNPTAINALLKNYGAGFVVFSPVNGPSNGNFVCVDAFTTSAQAQSAPACTSTHFNTGNPAGNASPNPYYLSVRADLKEVAMTPLGNMIPTINKIQINQYTGSIPMNNILPPTCGPGQGLQYDGTSFSCVDINPPNCSHPWQKLVYNGTKFICINISYVVAGGVAHPANPGGGVWDTDKSYILAPVFPSSHNGWTICQRNVTFTIPSGLPAGQVVARGNLIYPLGCSSNCTGDGAWHAWTVSFEHLNIPNGGTGSMDVCMSSGGNRNRTGQPSVLSEHVSWTIIYIPNASR